MIFNAEIKKVNVKVKKETDFEYPVTSLELEIRDFDQRVGHYVGKRVFTEMDEDISFSSKVKKANCVLKKVMKVDVPHTVVELELGCYDNRLGQFVSKDVEVSMEQE
jgi:hypothetical protein